MIIVMEANTDQKHIDEVIKKIKSLGYSPHIIKGIERTIIGAVGDEREKTRLQSLESMSGVESVVSILKPHKLANRCGQRAGG